MGKKREEKKSMNRKTLESRKYLGEHGCPWPVGAAHGSPSSVWVYFLLSSLSHSCTYLFVGTLATAGTVLGAEDSLVNQSMPWWGLHCSWKVCASNAINVQVTWYMRKCCGETPSRGDRLEPRGGVCNLQ